MNRKLWQRGHIELIFPVVLFLVFTLSALFIILYSARTYQHIVEESSKQYDMSTSMAYLTQKIHAADSMHSISLGDFGGIDSLNIFEEIEGNTFVSYIYVYDGYLRELFTSAKAVGVSPSAGTALFPANSFKADYINGGLLSLTIESEEGEVSTQLITIRSMR